MRRVRVRVRRVRARRVRLRARVRASVGPGFGYLYLVEDVQELVVPALHWYTGARRSIAGQWSVASGSGHRYWRDS
jgi:hypothetical protein